MKGLICSSIYHVVLFLVTMSAILEDSFFMIILAIVLWIPLAGLFIVSLFWEIRETIDGDD